MLAWGCGGSNGPLLDPPQASDGFQLKVAPFTVGPGVETQRCFFYAIPGTADQEVWVNHYTVAQPAGSHHMNVFRVTDFKNLSGKPGDVVVDGECFKSSNWSDWPLVVNSQQSSSVDWTMPDGVGAKFHGGDLIMLQTHWVNATTQQTVGAAQVAVNFYTMKTPPPNELGTMFATNQNIQICPGDVGRSFTANCKFPSATDDLHVVAANGHFHSRGVDFTMATVDAQGNAGAQFYESTVWDDPPMMRADRSTGQLADVPVGGGVQWTCIYDFPTTPGACGADKTGTPTPNCCYLFGPKVEVNEHCNAFVYYWPKTSDVNCF
jgi:hypothetical protein